MLDIAELATELQEFTAWQETPMPLGMTDYYRMVRRGIRKFCVDINHPSEYSTSNWITDDDGNQCYDRDFMADEIEYILCLCRIEFFRRVQTDVNNAFGYSTDALTVTNADKPYANLQRTLDDLERERRILFYKMTRYALGTG